MTLKLYNTLTKTKEEFTPLDPGKVKLYVCGPTVYDELHVGNFRGAIFFNCLRLWLEHLNYDVTYVYNYTDVDDKIIKKANERQIDIDTLTQETIASFERSYQTLGLKQHSHNPRCTHHIEDMVSFISKLIDKGVAYHREGTVFFEISQMADYGKLSGKNIEQLNAGHRVDPDPRKKSPLDFVLWKPAKEGEPAWESPWGPGRPGWHIECSVMNHAILGEQIDIHGGGIDLIFPHHENEIAQTEALTGKQFSTLWMHHNFIRFGNDKMSKSLGNVVTVSDFINEYHPEILKALMLMSHYRSELNFELSQIHQTMDRLGRIYQALRSAKLVVGDQKIATSFDKNPLFSKLWTTVQDALNDDMNTPIVFAAVFDAVRSVNHELARLKKGAKKEVAAQFLDWMNRVGALLGLFQYDAVTFLKSLDDILIKEKNIDVSQVQQLISDRELARQAKDFSKADSIRDELVGMGIEISDLAGQTIWEVKKG